ncbi:MAG: hypothetical protein HY691_14300 [Chloroflexi bacterium]|nr:hypothetical protein [Chloroflexota bacterium]
MSLERKDWALLAIAAAKGEPVSPVQLQKSLFLLGRELGNLVGEEFYEFEPYNYGPFAIAVYQDAEELAEEALITITRPPHSRYNKYRATAAGLEEAARIRDQAPARAAAYLDKAVAWARRLSFSELVQAIYAKYPETRVNSVFG